MPLRSGQVAVSRRWLTQTLRPSYVLVHTDRSFFPMAVENGRSLYHLSLPVRHEEPQLPNIASVLKEEIARLVRRELRGETESLRKASSRYRADIAALNRRIECQEKQISRLERMLSKKAEPVIDGESETKLRFKPQGVRAQRTRLGLSAPEMGTLVGVSAQTIYNWEAGKSRPRAEQLAIIAAVRKMGKREVRARLDQMQAD